MPVDLATNRPLAATGEEIIAVRAMDALRAAQRAIVVNEVGRQTTITIGEKTSEYAPTAASPAPYVYCVGYIRHWKLMTALMTTGSGFLTIHTAQTLLGKDEDTDFIPTTGDTCARVRLGHWETVRDGEGAASVGSRQRSEAVRPEPFREAAHLGKLSGLSQARLAAIFPTSRQSFHKWVKGLTPHDEHREHLLEVLALVEEAHERLGAPARIANWLLKPGARGGSKPIDLLAGRQYDTFRGYLLSVRTGQETIGPLMAEQSVYREVSDDEFENAMEQFSPRARLEPE